MEGFECGGQDGYLVFGTSRDIQMNHELRLGGPVGCGGGLLRLPLALLQGGVDLMRQGVPRARSDATCGRATCRPGDDEIVAMILTFDESIFLWGHTNGMVGGSCWKNDECGGPGSDWDTFLVTIDPNFKGPWIRYELI